MNGAGRPFAALRLFCNARLTRLFAAFSLPRCLCSDLPVLRSLLPPSLPACAHNLSQCSDPLKKTRYSRYLQLKFAVDSHLSIVISSAVEEHQDRFSVEGRLGRVVVFAVVIGALSSCGRQVSVPAYVVRGASAGVLGFVRSVDGWLLLRCNHERDLHAYRHGDEQQEAGKELCQAVLPRIYTTAELAAAQQRLAADLQRGTGEHAKQIGFSVALVALSLLISRAIVADVKKLIPITLAIGLALHHAHQRVGQIVSMQPGKETALAELRAPEVRHNSSMSLTIVEEVLSRYLDGATPPG